MLKIDSSWQEIESFSNLKLILDEISELIREGKIIYPENDKIFAAFNKTPLDKVRVVILGQDPYSQPNFANGLAFSVNAGIKLPRSLNKIFKELENDLGLIRTNSDLSDWAEQGVFLLNAFLTVEEGSRKCPHKHLWKDFTDNVIKLLNKQKTPIMFVLWGNKAKEKKKFITNPIHSTIESVHPSYSLANKYFLGSKPFSQINDFLIKNQQKPIKWG